MGRSWFKFNLSYPLTLLGSTLFLILGSTAMTSLHHYFRLTTRADAIIDQWKVVKKSSSSYPICGWYHFEFQGKTYNGTSFLPPPYHLNRLSAKKLIQLQSKSCKVWLDPYHPHISSFEKKLPLKTIVYTLISLGVTLYFWMVETHSKTRHPIN